MTVCCTIQLTLHKVDCIQYHLLNNSQWQMTSNIMLLLNKDIVTGLFNTMDVKVFLTTKPTTTHFDFTAATTMHPPVLQPPPMQPPPSLLVHMPCPWVSDQLLLLFVNISRLWYILPDISNDFFLHGAVGLSYNAEDIAPWVLTVHSQADLMLELYSFFDNITNTASSQVALLSNVVVRNQYWKKLKYKRYNIYHKASIDPAK